MTNRHFLEDFKLGNHFIAHGHNVMVADINQVNSTMNSVYDVVLFRNFVPDNVNMLNTIKPLYEEKIALIPDVTKVYNKYDVGLYVDVGLKCNIPFAEKVKEGIGYGLYFPFRVSNTSDNSNFVIQKVYEKYYHAIIIDGSIVYVYSESKGLKKQESIENSKLLEIASYLKEQDIDMAEVIFSMDGGDMILSFVDATYVTLDNRLCDESKLYSSVLNVIERKK